MAVAKLFLFQSWTGPVGCYSSCLTDHIMYACILQVGGQEHFYLETNAACVIPQENDEFLLISSTQVGKCWSGGEVLLWLEWIGAGLLCMP